MKSMLVIGLGGFGKHVAAQLNALGHRVTGIDRNEERVNDAMDVLADAQIGDSANEEFLRTVGIDNYDACLVCIGGDFQSSLETTWLLKELGARRVISRAEHDAQAKFLLRNGADEIVYPEKQVARWAAIRYSSDHILDYIELDGAHSIFEVSVPKAWIGASIGQLDIRKKYNINIMAVRKNGKLTLAITPDTVLTEDETMLVLGEHRALQKCFHI